MSYTFKRRFNRRYVSSTIICFFEYEKESGELKIGFNDGAIAYYQNIPGELIDQFDSAESKGKFFYRNFHDAGFKYHLESA